MDTLESIQTYDREYHEKCDNLKMSYKCTEQGKTCWWPECPSDSVSQGLCTKHRSRLKQGKLLVCSFEDHGDEDRHEIAETIFEFTQIAESNGVTPEKLLQMAVISIVDRWGT